MGELKNPKYELVARALARGVTQFDAVRAAGFKCRTRNPAYATCRRPEIRQRVRELMGEQDHLREKREQFRKTAKRARHLIGDPVTPEYLLLELQEQLIQARTQGNTRESLNCIKLMALISGVLKGPQRNPKKANPTKQQQENEALRDDATEDAYDDATDVGRKTEISDIDQLLGRLDSLTGDDTEEGLDSSAETSGDLSGDDQDRGPSSAVEGPHSPERTD